MSVNDPAWTVTVGNPTGALTIPAGSNRLLVIVRTMEYVGDIGQEEANSSLDVGGVAYSSRLGYTTGNSTDDQKIIFNFWDESDIGGMSGTDCVYAETGGTLWSPTKTHWGYTLFTGVNQTSPIKDSDSIETASGDTLTISALNAISGDYILGVLSGGGANRTYTQSSGFTELWDTDFTTGQYRSVAAKNESPTGSTDMTFFKNTSDTFPNLLVGLVIGQVASSPGGGIIPQVASIDRFRRCS